MDNIEVLKDIGLKEISDRTHIEVKHISYIVNSEFDKLNRVNTLGFIKIISREFDLDLSQWLEEAEKYWDEHSVDDDSPQIFIAQKPSVWPKIIYTFLTLLVLVAILYGAYLFLDKKLNFFDKSASGNDINYTYEQTPVVKEAKKNLLEQNITVDERDISTVDVSGNKSDEVSETAVEDYEKNSTSVENTETAESLEKVTEDKNVMLQVSDTDKGEKAVLTPNVKLWVGVIYLDDNSRDSFLGDGNFTIDLTRDQLITTGHGNFSISFDDGRVKKFNSQNPMKFMVKDGNLSEISLEKFKELNKGNLW